MSDRRSSTVVGFLPPNFAHADFTAEQLAYYDRVIEYRGYKIVHQPVVACACIVHPRDGGYGAPDANCPTCKGIGRLWDAGQQTDARALITGIGREKRFAQHEGTHEHGTMNCTFQSALRPEYHDRVKLVDAPMPISENLVRLAAGPQVLTLRFDAAAVTQVYARNPSTRAVVRLTPTTDFTFNATLSQITILPTAATFTGQALQLGVRYIAYPWFYVAEIPNQVRGSFTSLHQTAEKWVQLPTQTRIRRGDFMTDLTGP